MSPREALGAHGSGQLPLELVTVTTEQLASASAAGAPGPELEHLLDRAFGADGLGVICITGDDSFQARVRRIREDLLPLALALDRLPDADKAAIAEAGTLNVNNYSRGLAKDLEASFAAVVAPRATGAAAVMHTVRAGCSCCACRRVQPASIS
mmetsp:Transcript_32161/g.88864  ORF Transcript_32161/g.88864 Transcript_32161/m.88864 type:complete len:153 (+) Transcript_32161:93-551(+)